MNGLLFVFLNNLLLFILLTGWKNKQELIILFNILLSISLLICESISMNNIIGKKYGCEQDVNLFMKIIFLCEIVETSIIFLIHTFYLLKALKIKYFKQNMQDIINKESDLMCKHLIIIPCLAILFFSTIFIPIYLPLIVFNEGKCESSMMFFMNYYLLIICITSTIILILIISFTIKISYFSIKIIARVKN